ncbi:MAG: YidB family protein [Gammaproteobacteria bacterium]
MDLLDIAVKTLGNKIGNSGANSDLVKGVVGKLIGSGNSLDLAGLVDGLDKEGLRSVAESWLGDGENDEISTDQVKQVLGGNQIAEAAQALDTDEGSLLEGLKDLLPEMVDKSSAGGSLLDSVGGLGGLAKKFL